MPPVSLVMPASRGLQGNQETQGLMEPTGNQGLLALLAPPDRWGPQGYRGLTVR